MPIMGLRDPTYPQSWAQREVNLSLGLPLDFSLKAKAPLGLSTPGDGFSAMNKNTTRYALDKLKATLRNSSSALTAVKARLKSTKGITEDEELSAIVAPTSELLGTGDGDRQR